MGKSLRLLLVVSLLANVAGAVLIGALVVNEGRRGAAEAVGVVEPRRPAYDFYADERWGDLPDFTATVLLGDSQIERGPWSELLDEQVAVRGQSGARAGEVAEWVDTIPAGASRVVVWVGSNDVLDGTDDFEGDLRRLVDSVESQVPGANVALVTVPPLRVDPSQVNADIRSVAEETGAEVVDVTGVLAEPGMLAHDGVHLTGAGYEVVAGLLRTP